MLRNYVSCENVIYTIYQDCIVSVCFVLCALCVWVFCQLQIRANICKMCRTWLTCLKVIPKKDSIPPYNIVVMCMIPYGARSELYISERESVLCGARIFAFAKSKRTVCSIRCLSFSTFHVCFSLARLCMSAFAVFDFLRFVRIYIHIFKSTITTMMMMMTTTTTATTHTICSVSFPCKCTIAQSYTHTHTIQYIVYSSLSVELFEFISCANATVACFSLWHINVCVCVRVFNQISVHIHFMHHSVAR